MLEKFFSRMGREEKGFTLIELLIVVAIIGILAAIAIPNFLNARARATVSAVKADVKNIATAVETYQADNSQYPVTLTDLQPDYMVTIPSQPDGASTAYDYCTADPYQSWQLDTDGESYGVVGSLEFIYVTNGSGVLTASADPAVGCGS